MRRRAVGRLAAGLSVVSLAAGSAQAGAPGPDGCGRSYELAQEHRLEGRLRAAADQLLECAQAACPAFVRSDCARWLDEVQAAQPTLVFVARQAADGRVRDDVTVTCNGQPVATRLEGRAIKLDPGRQSCRFEAAGTGAATSDLLVLEGQKNRLVEVTLPALPEAPRSSVRVAPLLLAATGVAGVAGFVGLGLSGMRAEQRLRDSCAPDCAPSDVQSVRLRYRLADVSLGVGLLSAAAASYLFFRRSASPPAEVAVTVGPGGGSVVVGSGF